MIKVINCEGRCQVAEKAYRQDKTIIAADLSIKNGLLEGVEVRFSVLLGHEVLQLRQRQRLAADDGIFVANLKH